MSGIAVDHTGKTFGSWVVMFRAGSKKNGSAKWTCLCVCGATKEVPAESLVRGKSKSCGCLSQEMRVKNCTVHGHTRLDGYTSGTYRSWHAMRQRCENKRHRAFPDYGGRGISVHERWQSFEAFLADMGERPEGCSLDRINPDLNYSPDNCRWATRKEQALNKRPKTSHRKNAVLLDAVKKVIERRDEVSILALEIALASYEKKGSEQ